MDIFLNTKYGTIILSQEEFDYFFVYKLLNQDWLECLLQYNYQGEMIFLAKKSVNINLYLQDLEKARNIYSQTEMSSSSGQTFEHDDDIPEHIKTARENLRKFRQQRSKNRCNCCHCRHKCKQKSYSFSR